MKRTTRIRPFSKIRSAQIREYSKRVQAWKERPENRQCRVAGCTRRADDNHHSRGRIGTLLLDQRFWVPVCRQHHDWIGAHPAEARALGLIAPLGQWNTKPNDGDETI